MREPNTHLHVPAFSLSFSFLLPLFISGILGVHRGLGAAYGAGRKLSQLVGHVYAFPATPAIAFGIPAPRILKDYFDYLRIKLRRQPVAVWVLALFAFNRTRIGSGDAFE